jgi:DNA-binding SARP family transcriptional activator/TolB-like protein
MIRLKLLGETDLLGADGERIPPVLQQPKRLALLAYLVLDGIPGALRRRDTALLFFWPDATEKHARNALSQTVHFLRRWLGPGVIIDQGPGELGIDSKELSCDAVLFRQAIETGEWAEALRLYRGDLLAGFGISAGPEFEHWLEDQRSQLRRDAATGAWKLAEAAVANGHGDEGAAWGRRALELSLDDERAIQRLLRLLNQLGDSAGALEAYDRFRARLAREYDATPSAETRQIVASIRSGAGAQQPQVERPHTDSVSPRPKAIEDAPSDRNQLGPGAAQRAAAPTELQPAEEADLPTPSRAPSPRIHTLRPGVGRRLNNRWFWSVGFALTLVASVALYRETHSPVAARDATTYGMSTRDATTSIVVDSLLDVGGSPRAADLGAALTSAVVNQLVGVRSFEVTAEPPRGDARARMPSQPTGPHFVVTGHVVHAGDRLHVDVAVVDGFSGRIVETGAFEHPTGAALPVVDTLAREIATLVRTAVGKETERREWRRFATGNRAYGLMQEARDERGQAGALEQRGNFWTAVRALFAADSLLMAVERITPRWDAPSSERADVSNHLAALYLGPLHDPLRAESFLRRGIQQASQATALDPHDPAALTTLGSLYYWYWLTVPMPADSTSRMLARAEANLRAAVTSDPSRARAWNLLSASLFARADYSGAYLSGTRAYAGDQYLRESEDVLHRLVLTAYEIGDDSAAADWCDEAQRRFLRSWTSAYCLLALRVWNPSTSRAEHAASVAAAWTVARDGAAGAAHEPQAGPRLHMLVAAVLAHHGLRDSAEAVIRRARASDPGDDELLPAEADARIALGQRDSARALVTQYVAKRPLHRMGIARSRRFLTLHLAQSDFHQH